MESTVNDPGCGTLGILLVAPSNPQIRCCPYKNKVQFLNAFKDAEEALCQYLLLSGVTNSDFETLFATPGKGSPLPAWCTYDSELGLLLFRMPAETRVHSIAGMALHDAIRDALRDMGLESAVQSLGTGSQDAPWGEKQPDGSWRPRRNARGLDEWPSMALEVAYSETAEKLSSDVRWWLKDPGFPVRIVLTIKVHSATKLIFEKWERNLEGRPQRQQTISVERVNKSDTITVLEGPLVIGLEDLLRTKPSGPSERDIQIGDNELEDIARQVFEEEYKRQRQRELKKQRK
ncbi:uncharacterized protein BDV14DRAFT_197229 [Aspergillus stella-maris]|uniref:uncharacterized protein n=1 Tax=Aspergillus stella-maris TaxID=1810926 RepID=UPI003CCC9E2B